MIFNVNPCKKCIVQASCSERCHKYRVYDSKRKHLDEAREQFTIFILFLTEIGGLGWWIYSRIKPWL